MPDGTVPTIHTHTPLAQHVHTLMPCARGHNRPPATHDHMTASQWPQHSERRQTCFQWACQANGHGQAMDGQAFTRQASTSHALAFTPPSSARPQHSAQQCMQKHQKHSSVVVTDVQRCPAGHAILCALASSCLLAAWTTVALWPASSNSCHIYARNHTPWGHNRCTHGQLICCRSCPATAPTTTHEPQCSERIGSSAERTSNSHQDARGGWRNSMCSSNGDAPQKYGHTTATGTYLHQEQGQV